MWAKTIRVTCPPGLTLFPHLTLDVPKFIKVGLNDLIIHPAWKVPLQFLSEDERDDCPHGAFVALLSVCLQCMEMEAPEAAAWIREDVLDFDLAERPYSTMLFPTECVEEIRPN